MPYVGAPFGMWQWVPMTRLSEHGITSYSAFGKDFLGFVSTRQPAPWMGEFGQVSIQAQAGDKADCDYATRGVKLVKEKCVYTPYYAKVVTSDGVVSEVTASSRAAILRFTFPKGAKRRLVFDASRFFMSCFAIDRPQPGGISFGSLFSSRTVSAWNTDRCDSLETPDLKNFAARFGVRDERSRLSRRAHISAVFAAVPVHVQVRPYRGARIPRSSRRLVRTRRKAIWSAVGASSLRATRRSSYASAIRS